MSKKPQYPVFDMILAGVLALSAIGNMFFFYQWQEEKRENKGLRDFYEPHIEHAMPEDKVTTIPIETQTYIVEGFYPVASKEGDQGVGAMLRHIKDEEGFYSIFLGSDNIDKFDLDLKEGDKIEVTFEKDKPDNVLNIEIIE